MPNKEKYSRQMLLPEIGEHGQQRIAAAKVLMVGAGGLGCAALQYLAAAGIGHIGIVDGDAVTLSNLHRQVLYTPEDVGRPKAEIAAAFIKKLNPDVTVTTYPFFLHHEQTLQLLPQYDIVVDGSDNFATRYMLNDACALLQKPLVFAALSQWEAQIAVLHVAKGLEQKGINYRDIFPEPPAYHEVPNCAEAGVLGMLPGIIGAMQAGEVIKYITGAGQLINNGVSVYNLKNGVLQTMRIKPSLQSAGPADKEAFLLTNYEWLCGPKDVTEIGAKDLSRLIAGGAVFVDVREANETPDLPVPHQRLPLSYLRRDKVQVKGSDVVVVCHMGIRSIEAVRLLAQWAPAHQNLYSLKGGIMALAAAVQKINLYEGS